MLRNTKGLKQNHLALLRTGLKITSLFPSKYIWNDNSCHSLLTYHAKHCVMVYI